MSRCIYLEETIMKNIVIVCFAAIALLLLEGCGNNGEKQGIPVQFPKVELPSYINDNRQAANWLVRKYWDKFFALPAGGDGKGLSGTNSVNGVDSLSFEEAFGMYAQLLKMADGKSVASSVNNLFAKADSLALQGRRKPLLTFMEHMEHYFYNPNSPVLDEEIYLCALNGIMAARSLTELDKMQYEYQHRICSMNRVGTPAADFSFRQLLPDGNMSDKTLYKDVKGEYTLLFFNNPGCNACAEILEAIKGSPAAELVQKGKLKVLAMYIDEELSAWRENRNKFPDSWIYAHDPALVLRDNNIYGLRAIPSLYLLDKEKRVLLKDAPVDMVTGYFSSLK